MDWDKLKAGDDSAWLNASKDLLPFAKRTVRGQCPKLSDDEINGAAVEVLREIIDSFDTINSEKDLWGRLFERAWQRAIDKMREKDRQWNFLARADSLDVEEGTGHNPVDTRTPLPDADLDRAEIRIIIGENLDRLDPPDPEVLRDYYFEELNQREIGEKYGWETSSVGNRLNQTLKRARKQVSSDKRLRGFFF